MRWLLVLAFVAAAAGAAAQELAMRPALRITIGSAMPRLDPEDPGRPLDQRAWTVSLPVAIRTDECGAASAVSYSDLVFDRHGFDQGGDSNQGLYVERRGSDLVGRQDLMGSAGGTLILRIHARCSWRGRVATASAKRVLQLPTVSCNSGPLRVFELRGAATREDENHEAKVVPLRLGDLVAGDSRLRIAQGGRVVMGAPDCNGFRVVLHGGTYWTGTYDRGGDPYWFHGPGILSRADGNAAGFTIEGRISVRPLTVRCRDCTPDASSYEVRSLGDRTILRVYSGAVIGQTPKRKVRVRAGFELFVLCRRGKHCHGVGPRLTQPREGWTAPAHLRLVDPPRLVSSRPGRRPSLAKLVPTLADASQIVLPAEGGVPEQIAAEWGQQFRVGGSDFRYRQGVYIWERETPRRWREVYRREVPYGFSWNLFTGDVTRDGHDDVLLVESAGSGGCGRRLVLASVRGETRPIFDKENCEDYLRIAHGALEINEAVGPCPEEIGGAHCYGGRRERILRWNGRALVTAKATVRCELPGLDSECRPRRTNGGGRIRTSVG